jgi:hypothetical protein
MALRAAVRDVEREAQIVCALVPLPSIKYY